MNLASFSSKLRLACAAGALAMTACFFTVGCGAEANDGGESTAAEHTSAEHTDQATQAQTIGTATAAPVATPHYPPHGYPCLGCHPCGGSYCDNFNNMVVCGGNGEPVAQPVSAGASK